jgi:excinuclease ABC subunit C
VRTGGSKLEDIPGVGPEARAKLLQRFGGIRGRGGGQRGRDLPRGRHFAELAEEIYRALH